MDCQADKQAQLVLANAVLVKVTQDEIKEEFLKEMTEDGRVGKAESINSMYHVQFEDNKATEMVNKWAKEKTEGMISEILKPGEVNVETSVVLVNLLYFNGQFHFNPIILVC